MICILYINTILRLTTSFNFHSIPSRFQFEKKINLVVQTWNPIWIPFEWQQNRQMNTIFIEMKRSFRTSFNCFSLYLQIYFSILLHFWMSYRHSTNIQIYLLKNGIHLSFAKTDKTKKKHILLLRKCPWMFLIVYIYFKKMCWLNSLTWKG